jgi:hypothetical protein
MQNRHIVGFKGKHRCNFEGISDESGYIATKNSALLERKDDLPVLFHIHRRPLFTAAASKAMSR